MIWTATALLQRYRRFVPALSRVRVYVVDGSVGPPAPYRHRTHQVYVSGIYSVGIYDEIENWISIGLRARLCLCHHLHLWSAYWEMD